MYIIKAQYKNRKAVTIDRISDKETVFALCLEYAFSFGNDWKVWYTARE